jgi:hypothetical protein
LFVPGSISTSSTHAVGKITSKRSCSFVNMICWSWFFSFAFLLHDPICQQTHTPACPHWGLYWHSFVWFTPCIGIFSGTGSLPSST